MLRNWDPEGVAGDGSGGTMGMRALCVDCMPVVDRVLAGKVSLSQSRSVQRGADTAVGSRVLCGCSCVELEMRRKGAVNSHGEVDVETEKAPDGEEERDGDDTKQQIRNGPKIRNILLGSVKLSRGKMRLTTTCPPSSHFQITYPVSSATNALNAVAYKRKSKNALWFAHPMHVLSHIQ